MKTDKTPLEALEKMKHRFVIKNIKTPDIICKALDCYLRNYFSIGECTKDDIYSIYLKIK